ncbi:ubiquitin C-terminal hydrolase 12-like [Trifolium pratense]|uniref:ubiquitin C-terminal hydrolase 12-like n=1 Tax=Trifolium pratense TaxID=57577 RepID=UPI001E694201|nr:ubiquitin C-terminal hydrolase 12-like [Trifolium pratense]
MENITGWMAPGSKDERRTNTVVAQPEIANTVDRLHVKEPSPFRFTWRIDRFSQKKLKKKKVYSDVFEVGGSKWRLLIFPYGNNVDFLSVYLAVANSYSLPCDWSRHANFSMKVVNQYYYYLSKRKGSLFNLLLKLLHDELRCMYVEHSFMKHRFNERESDWGFRYFIPFDELYNPSRGYLVNDTLVVEVEVEVTCSVDEKEDEDLYTYIKVVQDEDLVEQIGNYIFFDLVDDEKVRSFRVQKKTTFYIFKEEVANEFGIPAQFLRFWLWEKRQNNTYRPSRPLTQIEEAGPVGQFNTVFLEVEHGPGFRLITPLNKRNDDILLFFKLYYPEKEELRYVGKLFVNRTDKPPEILTKLNKLAGYDPDEEINLFEEIRFSPVVMCEPVDKKLTFQQSEVENGDIICFQKASAMDNVKLFRYPDVPSYLKYVSNERSSAFSSSGKESKDEQSSEEQNKNIIDFQQTNCNENTDALESKVKIETIEKIDAMVDEDVIVAIDKVLSEWITISLQYQPSNGGQEKVSKLLQELRNIAFKEDLVKKFKEGLVVHEVNFNAVKEKIDANDDLFSSHQLEQVSVVVNLLNNIVRVFEKLEKLKKERDSAKKSIDQDKEALKETRQKILTSKTSFTNHQTEFDSLDAQIYDLKAKLEELQGERAKIAEVQDQEKDKITSLNKEVKSILHRLVDDQIKLKNVVVKIVEAETNLQNLEKLYQTFKKFPPF